MAERSLSNQLGDFIDQLCTVQYLNEAIQMAASDSSVTRNATDALQSLTTVIDAKIVSLKEQIEEMREDSK